jgi:DUF4097 and DUF4098 domain-containing protein YvlB
MKQKLIFSVMFGLVVLAHVNALGSGETVTYEEQLAGITAIEVSTGSVDVYVVRSSGEGHVIAELDSEREFTVGRSGRTARIEVTGNVRSSLRFRGQTERLDLAVPDGVDIEISVGSADVMVERVSVGRLSINGGSSDLRLERVNGAFDLSTGSGDVTLDRADGSIVVSAQSGDVVLSRVVGVRSIETGSGDIRGRGLRIEDALAIVTGSGDATIDLDHDLDELTITLTAGSGDLRINDTRGETSLRSGTGDIRVTGTSGSGDQRYNTR